MLKGGLIMDNSMLKLIGVKLQEARKNDYFVTGSEIKEPDIQIAFRGENLCNEDLKTIAWAKTFLNNLSEMNDLIKE